MGRRSRKRADLSTRAEPTPEPIAPMTRRQRRLGEAPKPIWAPFPLVELAILLGAVFVVAGLIWGGGKGQALLGCGVAVISLASLEIAIREHFTGYKSHSALLALVPMAITLGVLVLAVGLTERFVALGIAIAVFVICFLALREVFRRRSGGLSFRA